MASEFEKLHPFLEMDIWSPEQAINLLLGYFLEGEKICSLRTGQEIGQEEMLANKAKLEDPYLKASLRSLGCMPSDYAGGSSDPRYTREYKAYEENKNRYLDQWGDSRHDKEGVCFSGKYSKQYCVQWAISKGIEIPWLQWAIDNHLLPPDVGLANSKVTATKKRITAWPLQEEVILETIRSFGFDPESLPKTGKGKPTVKLDVREKLLSERKDLFGESSFSKAWERLRKPPKRIKEVE